VNDKLYSFLGLLRSLKEEKKKAEFSSPHYPFHALLLSKYLLLEALVNAKRKAARVKKNVSAAFFGQLSSSVQPASAVFCLLFSVVFPTFLCQ
jgi:hypothetical protein